MDYDDEQSSDLMQTYISTNQISDRLISENGDHELRSEFDEVVVGETTVIENDDKTFKRPAQPPHHSRPHKDRKSTNRNDKNQNVVSRPTRDIVSCFMTTSGFISPAREGKLPEPKKPIVLPSDEPPEEIVAKVECPSPEPADVGDEQAKRQKRDRHEMELDVSNARRDNDRPFDNQDNDNEVKLYEVIQTAPLDKSPPKKKPRRSLTIVDQPPKETKKQKKLKQLNLAKNKKPLSNDLDFHLDENNLNARLGAFSGLHGAVNPNTPPLTEKQKKKLQKMESLKKKHRKERQLGNVPFLSNDSPTLPGKQRKKKLPKPSKKNLAAMGLDPSSIEGFPIPPSVPGGLFDPMLRPNENIFKTEPSSSQHKDGQKKNKQMDKQKIKFFKKLQSTSSSLLSRPSDDLDRSISPEPVPDWNADRAPTNVDDYNWSAVSISDEPSAGKKSKQQKKSKPPKEIKPVKVKKPKEGKSPTKKPRTPKLPRIPEEQEPTLPVTPKLEKSPQPPSPKPQLPKPHPTFIPGMDLLNRFPGPGLIPSNPLFQSFQFDMSSSNQMPHYPFPGLPGFDFANMNRFKRPNFGDSPSDMTSSTIDKTPEVNTFATKPLCNVASLMPPSLASEMGSTSTPFVAKSTSTPFGPKKSATVTSPTATFDKREPFASPIVIDSEEDFSRQNSMSQSPTHQQSDAHDSAGHTDEVKRKKNKDKSSKEGKKDKKDKELGVVKLKKKKDKKDKVKNKQRHGEHSKSPKDKDKAQLKKEKREKKKEKERAAAALAIESREGSQASISEWSRDAFGRDGADNSSMDFNADNSSMEANAIPKLTLKFSSSPSSRTSRPSTPDFPANQLKS